MKLRFINSGFNDAFTNMAVDEAILFYCQMPTLRVYQFRFDGENEIEDDVINGQGFVLAAGVGLRF